MEFKFDRLKVPLCFFVLTVFLMTVAILFTYKVDAATVTQDRAVAVEAASPEVTTTSVG